MRLFLWEIQYRELAIIFYSRCIKRLGRFFRSTERSEVFISFVDSDGGRPSPPVNFYSSIPGCTLSSNRVHLVLTGCTGAKVRDTIVERIVIDVISNFSRSRLEDDFLHGYKVLPTILLSDCGERVKCICKITPRSMPAPLHKEFIFMGIYYRVLTSCQWNLSAPFTLNYEYVFDDRGFPRRDSALITELIARSLPLSTFWAMGYSAWIELPKTIFARLISWLGSRFRSVHDLIPMRLCGLATLESF